MWFVFIQVDISLQYFIVVVFFTSLGLLGHGYLITVGDSEQRSRSELHFQKLVVKNAGYI